MKTLLLAALALVLAGDTPAAAHVPQGDPEMPYAARADLVDRFGADEIDALAPLAEGASPRADAALADASAEIDSLLAEGFEMPLPSGVYPALVSIGTDLARVRLYDDAAPEQALGRASSARKRLRELAEGKRALLDANGGAAPRRSHAAIAPGAGLFTRGALRDL